VSPVEKDEKYLELVICFIPVIPDVKVIMLQSWTPKMYLTPLNNSTRKHSIVSLELITIDGRIYTTINELQWLFGMMEEDTHSQLICLASYIYVSGGGVLK
jgi:hypothetical protein